MADGSAAAAAPSSAPMFRRPTMGARNNARKRVRVDDDDTKGGGAEEGRPAVVRAERSAKPGPMVHFTARIERKADAGGVGVQSSDRRITAYDNKVFATNEQETRLDRDARAIFDRSKDLEAVDSTTAGGERVYKGMNNYRQYTERPSTFDAAVVSGQGPQRAPQHYRAICRFDYQPDVCKDYKETGFCGYGDACKFLHDRGDYKSGWQLEKEWDNAEKERAKRLEQDIREGGEGGEEEEETKDEDLPFACLLCHTKWTSTSNPVVTKCGHHFCEACACAHLASSKRCYVCNEPTHGTFNAAKRLREHIKAMLAPRSGKDLENGGSASADPAAVDAILNGLVEPRQGGEGAGKAGRKSTVSSWTYE